MVYLFIHFKDEKVVMEHAMNPQFELLVDGHYALAESPVYDDRTGDLLWVDITEGTLHACKLNGSERRAWHFSEPVGCVGLTESGRLIVALRHSVALFDRTNGHRETIATLPHVHNEMRTNDGKVGPDGAFWISTMDDRAVKESIGAVYRIALGGFPEEKIGNLRISNGLAWTADGKTMFHTDTRGPWIERWDFDPVTGAISGRTRIRDLDDTIGRPDGGACDLDGNYWSAGISAARLNQFNRDGELLAHFAAPVPRPTMISFMGADFTTMVVTTAGHGLSDEALKANPHAGGIFTLKANIHGVPPFRFKDFV